MLKREIEEAQRLSLSGVPPSPVPRLGYPHLALLLLAAGAPRSSAQRDAHSAPVRPGRWVATRPNAWSLRLGPTWHKGRHGPRLGVARAAGGQGAGRGRRGEARGLEEEGLEEEGLEEGLWRWGEGWRPPSAGEARAAAAARRRRQAPPTAAGTARPARTAPSPTRSCPRPPPRPTLWRRPRRTAGEAWPPVGQTSAPRRPEAEAAAAASATPARSAWCRGAPRRTSSGPPARAFNYHL